jgi:hypothetical protein
VVYILERLSASGAVLRPVIGIGLCELPPQIVAFARSSLRVERGKIRVDLRDRSGAFANPCR